MRILFTFLLITLTATATHTHSNKLWQLWQQQQHNTATVSTNPANLFVSTSPRFATLGQLPLSGVCDNGQRVRGLPRPAIAPSPSLSLTCTLLSHSLSASIPNATNQTTQDSCIETMELIRLMRKEEDNNCIR